LPAVTVRLLPAGHLIQRITLRVISPTFCIATVRLNATNLKHQAVEVRPDCKSRIRRGPSSALGEVAVGVKWRQPAP
jgi:hypothetical protein